MHICFTINPSWFTKIKSKYRIFSLIVMGSSGSSLFGTAGTLVMTESFILLILIFTKLIEYFEKYFILSLLSWYYNKPQIFPDITMTTNVREPSNHLPNLVKRPQTLNFLMH